MGRKITGIYFSIIMVLFFYSSYGITAEKYSDGSEEKEKEILNRLQELTKSEKLTIEGLGYIRYWYEIQDGNGETEGESEPRKNSFELWRFYAGLKSTLSSWLRLRFTIDVGPEKEQTTSENQGHTHKVQGENSYQLFVKYAWIDFMIAQGLNIRAGILEFPLHEFIDNLWGYRFVAKNAGEENGLWSSADLGAYLGFEIPDGIGSLKVGVANGAGYKNALDVDSAKELWVYMMFSPLKPVTRFLENFQIGGTAKITLDFEDSVDRFVVLSPFVGFSNKWFMVGYHTLIRFSRLVKDEEDFLGIGHGVYFSIRSPWKIGIFGQFNNWKPNKDIATEETFYEVITGMSYSPASFFSIALSCFLKWQDIKDNPSTPDVIEEASDEKLTRIMLSSQIKF